MKKYILLAITLFMMTNNALADEKGGFDSINPVVLSVEEAYTLYNKPKGNIGKIHFNLMALANFEKGILSAILSEQKLNGISESEQKELINCLFDRPITVFENLLFRYYEENKINGKSLYGGEYYTIVKNQCVK